MATEYRDVYTLSLIGTANSAIGNSVAGAAPQWTFTNYAQSIRATDGNNSTVSTIQRQLQTLVNDLVQRGILPGQKV